MRHVPIQAWKLFNLKSGASVKWLKRRLNACLRLYRGLFCSMQKFWQFTGVDRSTHMVWYTQFHFILLETQLFHTRISNEIFIWSWIQSYKVIKVKSDWRLGLIIHLWCKHSAFVFSILEMRCELWNSCQRLRCIQAHSNMLYPASPPSRPRLGVHRNWRDLTSWYIRHTDRDRQVDSIINLNYLNFPLLTLRSRFLKYHKSLSHLWITDITLISKKISWSKLRTLVKWRMGYDDSKMSF